MFPFATSYSGREDKSAGQDSRLHDSGSNELDTFARAYSIRSAYCLLTADITQLFWYMPTQKDPVNKITRTVSSIVAVVALFVVPSLCKAQSPTAAN